MSTYVCVFNQTSKLIDITLGQSAFVGPSVAGSPVVLNSAGLLDPSLFDAAITATVDTGGVGQGNLVTLYVSGGILRTQPATASPTGVGILGPVPPGGFPTAALGFVTTGFGAGTTATVSLMGLFTYIDPIAEFSASSVGRQVYLADSGDGSHGVGAITLTPPSAVGASKQAVGVVIGYNGGVVSANFAPIANEVTTFDNVLSGTSLNQTLIVGNGSSLSASGTGTIIASQVAFSGLTTGANSTATMTVAPGAVLTFSSTTSPPVTGVINANEIYSVVISAVVPVAGQALIATSGSAAAWGKLPFNNVDSGTNVAATMTVGTGATLTFSGSGIVNASEIFGTGVTAAASVANQAPVYNGAAYVPTLVEVSSNWRTIRYGVDFSPPVAISIPAGTLGGPYTVNFSSPFADNNYTVVATAEIGEAMSTAPCYVGGVEKQAAGVGVTVWVANNDSISHTVTINVVARHD
jgi:hypothetical protein